MRLVEDCAVELGRLDAVARIAPPGLGVVLRLAATARLEPVPLDALVAAEGDVRHLAALTAASVAWRDLVLREERLVRSGVPLAAARVAVAAPSLATYLDRARLEATWRETGTGRAVLHRALEAAAWVPDAAVGEFGAAMVLCAGGLTDRVRIAPFADVPAADRASACAAWRAGDESPWRTAALGALARRARAVRRAADGLPRAIADEDRALDALGRAAITARRARTVLHATGATTMPALAEVLGTSRPASADALERLVAAGIAREVTGRARDRVYAWTAALAVGEAALAPVDG